jgi:YVTN family beta-propeller protein
MNKNLLACVFVILLTLTSVCSVSQATPDKNASYHIIRKISVGGQGGWDYLLIDPDTRRLYVSHSTQVEVVDIDSDKRIGNIPNTPGVHGIAIAPSGGQGYISNGKAASVTVFDTKSLKKVAEVPVGNKPDAIIFDPSSSRVFAFNGADGTTTAINSTDNKVAGTVKVGASPEFAVADDTGFVFNNSEDESVLLKINAKELKVEQRWPLAPCSAPSSMDIDRKNHRIFVGCRNKTMAVVNSDSGQVITTLPIGDHVDATAFDQERGLIFNSNGEGNVTVIRQDGPDQYKVVQTIPTLPRSKTMALDKKTHQLYVPAMDAGQFVILVIGQ